MTISDFKIPKIAFMYNCINCNYYTSVKKDFNKHLLTLKHKRGINDDENKNLSHFTFACDCGKKYKYRQGLSYHKKKCSKYNVNDENDENNKNNDISELKSMIKDLIIENGKLQNKISELIPKVGNNIIQNNNNKFNIQVFLNEKCKDAINMSDFVKSIQVSFQQLDFTKQNGIVSGLTNVIIENMNKLGLHERPIHCTDTKRESIYIKDDDIWIKDINKEKIKKAIKGVSTKQFCALSKWTKENPDFIKNESKQDYYTHTLVAIANNKESNEDKIIKKLCLSSFVKEY